MNQNEQQLNYTLQLADNLLIHAQRLGEWCGHGPILEQDIALTNTCLDHIGAARPLYQYAAEQVNKLTVLDRQTLFTSPALEQVFSNGKTASEDDIAYLRDAWDFKNVLLVEQPNDDWAFTMSKCFFLDAFHVPFYKALQASTDKILAGVAEKSLKEVNYHLKWSSEWVIRLGDGTDESHEKMQTAINERWAYTGELFQQSEADIAALAGGFGVDLSLIKTAWDEHIAKVFEPAKLTIPTNDWMQKGGKDGMHTEHLGYILAEMQYMQRAYPGMEW
jgi:ring-1,2-phenylacetyl-CoA epoxidase subunit PaaC